MAMEPMPGMAADEPLRTALAGVGRDAPILPIKNTEHTANCEASASHRLAGSIRIAG
jgi:hypothetical protein